MPSAMAGALALAAAGAVSAQQAGAAPPAAKTAAPATVRIVPATALIAVRDAITGELREPTAEEAAALVASARTASFVRGAAAAPRVYSTPSGGRGLTLGESTFGLAIAKKRADGSVVEACVSDPKQAARFFVEEGLAHDHE